MRYGWLDVLNDGGEKKSGGREGGKLPSRRACKIPLFPPNALNDVKMNGIEMEMALDGHCSCVVQFSKLLTVTSFEIVVVSRSGFVSAVNSIWTSGRLPCR